MLQKNRGIVLKARDYGESNQIVQVFSETQGKFAMMARGSKKPKSRFRAVTEPFTEGDFICYLGSGMATLSQGDIVDAHHKLRSDLLKTTYGAYWFELIDQILPEKEPHPQLYQLLSTCLTRLERGTHAEILTRIVELRMMEVAGYQPVFQHCVQCQSTHSLTRISVIHGGFLCSNCVQLDPHALPVTEAVARILPVLQSVDMDRLGNITVKPETDLMLKQVIHAFMDEYVEGKWKIRSMIDRLKD